ncbi:MAG: TRAP transporter small permease subunit, partial [Thermodesulfobacteriota bacterium]
MRFLKAIDSINEWMGKLFSPTLLLIMILAVYEVIRRYVFTNPTTWVWEINSQLLCFMGAMAGGYTMLNNGHVSVDILSSRFPPRVKALVDIITSSLFFILVLALIYYGTKEALRAFQVNQKVISQFASPLWPIKFIIP